MTNPHFFADRKQLDMRQLVLAADIKPGEKSVIDGAGVLDEVGTYPDAHTIGYDRNQITRTAGQSHTVARGVAGVKQANPNCTYRHLVNGMSSI
jgi:hypothetical protein